MTYLTDENNPDPHELIEAERANRVDAAARAFIMWKGLEVNGNHLAPIAEQAFNKAFNQYNALFEGGNAYNIAHYKIKEAVTELYEGEFRALVLGNPSVEA
jgi:hypothetical protein